MYLWHIPLVGVLIAVAWVCDLGPALLGPSWWGLHLGVALAVVALAWLLAGPVGRLSRRISARAAAGEPRRTSPVVAAVVVAATIVALSQTGFATWWGARLLSVPMSSLVLTPLLVAAWWTVSAGVGADDRGRPGRDVADLPGRDATFGQ